MEARARVPFSPETIDAGAGRRDVGIPRRVLLFRLAALMAAQLFDLATFTIMVARHGIRHEMNPLIAHAFAGFGLPALVALKLALVLLLGSIVILLARLPRGRRRSFIDLAALITVLGVAGGLVGGVSNFLVH